LCQLQIDRFTPAARLEVSAREFEAGDLLLSSPVLTSRQMTAHPSVFVFLIDTVRADKLMTFNPDIPLGEALERLARDGIVFERLQSSSSWTRTAVATLLTGLSPQAHKVLDRSDVVPADLVTLPQILQQQGYQTAAWSANPNVLPLWGFATGFDSFTDVGAFEWVTNKAHAKRVLDLVHADIEEHRHEAGFYYVQLMDAHGPYTPEEVYLQKVQAAAPLMASYPIPQPGSKPYNVAAEYPKYLAGIMELDEQLGFFFDYLKTIGMYDSSLILVASDHGEEFAEHGEVYHGKTLYEEVLHVPVFLKLPGNASAGARIVDAVDLADVMPTMLRALGLPVPPRLDGHAILGGEGSTAAAPPQVAVLKLDGRHFASVASGGWKLIVNYGGADELYNLQADPLERTNLFSSEPVQADQMRARLDERMVGRQAGWHIRGCGSMRLATVRFNVDIGAAAIHSAMFEAEDSITVADNSHGGRTATVTMTLRPRPTKREFFGRLLSGTTADEDEVLIVPSDDKQQSTLLIETADGGDLTYTLGTVAEHLQAAQIALDSTSREARVRPSDVVECAPMQSGGQQPPLLRVWFVAAPESRPAPAVDPATAERLRALGYKW
jgi:arylsulfatase A-like enzyme